MPNKSLSVQPEDLPLWDRGEQKAKAARQSMSGYVLSLIERDNHRGGSEGQIVDDVGLIVVRMHAPGRGAWRESFTGKWVTSADPAARDATFDQTGWCGVSASPRPSRSPTARWTATSPGAGTSAASRASPKPIRRACCSSSTPSTTSRTTSPTTAFQRTRSRTPRKACNWRSSSTIPRGDWRRRPPECGRRSAGSSPGDEGGHRPQRDRHRLAAPPCGSLFPAFVAQLEAAAGATCLQLPGPAISLAQPRHRALATAAGCAGNPGGRTQNQVQPRSGRHIGMSASNSPSRTSRNAAR